MKKGILLCCHGTRSTDGIKDTLKLFKIFKKKKKNFIVKIGYLESATPNISSQIDFFLRKNFDIILIKPAMIFPGNHVNKDIPKIIENSLKKYKKKIKIKISYPLLKSKKFIKNIQFNLKEKLSKIDKKETALIVVASYTINIDAKSEINFLTKKLAKNEGIRYYKNILITLNKENLKQQLNKLSVGYSKFIILPIFLFRGKLLKNLISVIDKLNKKNNKYVVCKHFNDYKKVENLIDSSKDYNYINKL